MTLIRVAGFALGILLFAQSASAQLHIPKTSPKRTLTVAKINRAGFESRTVVDDVSPTGTTSSTAPQLDLFGGVLAGLSSDHAYVHTPIVQGIIKQFDHGAVAFEFGIAEVVAPKDTAPGVTREDFQRRVSTLLRLVNNGGTYVARMMGAWSGRLFAGDAQAGLDGSFGVVDPASGNSNATQRGAMGAATEASIAWDLLPMNDAVGESPGQFQIAVRGGINRLAGGTISEGLSERQVHFVQFIAQLHKGDKVLFGVSYTAGLNRNLRRYVPAVQFTIGAGSTP